MKKISSRALAYTWPYCRHHHYESDLQEAAANWFADREFPTSNRYQYILANREQWPQNIILPEVAEFIQRISARRVAEKRGFPLHKYIHHGLSSQAMLFNLIGPLIAHRDFEPLQEVFDAHGLTWPREDVEIILEYEDRQVFNEDTGQPTSVDMVIRDGSGGSSLFIEAKLVEKEFGSCSVFAGGDCDGRNRAQDFSLCYLHHIGRRYWELLDKHRFLEGPLGGESTCVLSIHYQFFREVLFAVELGGTFVLLHDERSPTFRIKDSEQERGLMPFLMNFVPSSLKSRVGLVCIQEIVKAIKSSDRHPWIREFERKYGLVSAPTA